MLASPALKIKVSAEVMGSVRGKYIGDGAGESRVGDLL